MIKIKKNTKSINIMFKIEENKFELNLKSILKRKEDLNNLAVNI